MSGFGGMSDFTNAGRSYPPRGGFRGGRGAGGFRGGRSYGRFQGNENRGKDGSAVDSPAYDVCNFYVRGAGCRNGANCRFSPIYLSILFQLLVPYLYSSLSGLYTIY